MRSLFLGSYQHERVSPAETKARTALIFKLMTNSGRGMARKPRHLQSTKKADGVKADG